MEAEDDHGQWNCAISDAEAAKMETDEQKLMEAVMVDAFAAQIFHLIPRLYL